MDDGKRRWPGDDETKPAPPPLRRIQALVNTVERPDGDDRLADPADARAWLIAHGLLAADGAVTDDDLALLVAVREALRALLVANGGGPSPSPEQLAPLQRVADRAAARLAVDGDGVVALSTAGGDLAAALGGVLLAMRDAQRDGTWTLLKACGNDECQWAFYDASRNHGGLWCDMATCGNKVKNREFRARRRTRRQLS